MASSVVKYYARLKRTGSQWVIPNTTLELTYYVPTDSPTEGFLTIEEAQKFVFEVLPKVKEKHKDYQTDPNLVFDVIAVTIVATGRPPAQTIVWDLN